MVRALSQGFRLPTFTEMRLVASSSIAADLMIVYDGEQALKLRRVKVDFTILDLAMPKFDDFMVLQNYHTQNEPPVAVFTISSRERKKSARWLWGRRTSSRNL